MKIFYTPLLCISSLFMPAYSVLAQPVTPGTTNRVNADPQYSKIYWTNNDNNTILRMNLDGTGKETFVTNSGAYGLEIDIPHQKVYFYNEGINAIQRQNFNGTNRETVVANSGFNYMMILDIPASKLYWANFEGKSIEKVNFDGTGRQTIISNISRGADGPIAFELDFLNSKIYWYDNNVTSIRRANLNGSSQETFLSSVSYVYSMVIDKNSQKLYFPNYDPKTIERINLNGTGRETVVTAATSGSNPFQGPISIALDNVNSKIYWYDENINTIRRANLNNTGKENYITNSGFNYALVLPVEDAISLPLNLESFTAQSTDKVVSLTWKTSKEVNVAAFDVERAANNRDFSTIATVNANAKDGLYGHIDQAVNGGNNYLYRLKMRDNDGQFRYSPVINVNTAFKINTGEFSLFPNPVSSPTVYLKGNTNSRDLIDIIINDRAGKMIYRGTIRKSNNRYNIPVTNLPSGMYTIQIINAQRKVIEAIEFLK